VCWGKASWQALWLRGLGLAAVRAKADRVGAVKAAAVPGQVVVVTWPDGYRPLCGATAVSSPRSAAFRPPCRPDGVPCRYGTETGCKVRVRKGAVWRGYVRLLRSRWPLPRASVASRG